MNTFVKALRLLQSSPKTTFVGFSVQRISTTTAMYQPRSLVKMKQNQAKFQCEDGKPVFLKAGFRDRILYCTTLVLSILGLVLNFMTIYEHAKPVSWRTEPIC